jgi:hypothetical protein
MPVARGSGISARNALVVGASGVIAAVVLGFMVLYLAKRSENVSVRLGDDRFRDIDAEKSARTIAKDGPVIYRDLAGGDRDIYVQHLGADPRQGWLAFDVRPPGEPRACALVWQAEPRQFGDNGRCTRSYTVPADGTGLRQYPATVDDTGKVVVDLNAAERAAPTSTSPTSTSFTSTTTPAPR